MSEYIGHYDEEEVPVSGIYRVVNTVPAAAGENEARTLQNNIECYKLLLKVKKQLEAKGHTIAENSSKSLTNFIHQLRTKTDDDECIIELDAAENLLMISPVDAQNMHQFFMYIHMKAVALKPFIHSSKWIDEPKIGPNGEVPLDEMEAGFAKMETNLLKIELEEALKNIGIIL
jgi:hypothetical protein